VARPIPKMVSEGHKHEMVVGSLLFFISPIGGFQYADYLYNGHCLVYDLKKEEVTARGKLALPEDAKLFITENRIILAVLDHEDSLVLKEVRLGWVH